MQSLVLDGEPARAVTAEPLHAEVSRTALTRSRSRHADDRGSRRLGARRRLSASHKGASTRVAQRPPQRGRPATATARVPAGRLSSDEVTTLVRSATDDERSWDALVREFNGMILAIARAHRLSNADAADVAQTTWLRLLEHLDDLHDPARTGAWLATTARRECLRLLDGVQRQLPLADDPPERTSPYALPGKAMLLRERNQGLWRCFERLRPSDQALLRLLIADPPPAYEEIAAALDMPIGSIGPMRARAVDRLRQQLDSEQTLALLREEAW